LNRRPFLAEIGNTPLVQLDRLFPSDGHRGIQVYAKLELMNPNGSAKDRPAIRIIQEALKSGLIAPGSVVIESSSGNMAISLAAICSYYGMRFISVIDPKTSPQSIRIMKAYGAQIEYVAEPDKATGEFLPARLARVQELLAANPNSYWPNQYENEHNYMSHYEGTMREIAQELGSIDYLFGGVSTCGTMLGSAKYAREHGMTTKLVGVDAVGSVIFGGQKSGRRFPGLGAGIVPPFARVPFLDEVVHIREADMIRECHELANQEAIVAGPSSGAVIAAVKRSLPALPDGVRCVAIIHDRGERYLETVYSRDWVKEHFGIELQSGRNC